MHLNAARIRNAAALVLTVSIASGALGAQSDFRRGLQLYEERKWSSAYKTLRPLAEVSQQYRRAGSSRCEAGDSSHARV
jgi:hypothetical protein